MKKSVIAIVALLLVVGVVVGGVIAGYFYFRGSEKHLQLVPKNAMFVATIDFVSLAKKSDFSKIQELNWYKDMQKQASDKAQGDEKSKGLMEVINHPLSCGINLLSDVYIFGVNNGPTGIAGGLIFDIKDADAFEKSVKKIAPDAKIVSGSNYKWIQQNDVAVAWNKTGGIVAGAIDKNGTAKLSEFLDATFGRKLSESILANEQFEKFNVTRKDISYFINMGELYTAAGNFSSDPTSNMFISSFNASAKDAYMWSNVDFQKERVFTTTHIEMPASAANTLSILSKSGLSDDHLKAITTKDCYLLTSINCDADKLFASYETMPSVKQNLDQMAMMTGMTTKDLENIFGGELSIALVDFKKVNMPQANNPEDPDGMIQQSIAALPLPVFTVNFSSKNKDGVKKLLEGKLQMNADGYYQMPVYRYVNVNLVPNKFGYTLTNDNDIAKTIAGGGNLGSLPDKVNDLAKNNPAVFYMNLDLNTYPQPIRDVAAQALGNNYKAFAAYMSMFKDVVAKGNQQDSEVSINLTPGDGNSLYRFFAQGDESYKILKQ